MDLDCFDLRNVYLCEANSLFADLSDAALFFADLFSADLRNTDLRDSNLLHTNLLYAELNNTMDLSGAKFHEYQLSNKVLKKINNF